ncbi:MAG TPA: tryptophan halogenase family protein [Caulobacterales bacterium]|nr:tryptophan halogenase family protein [Caulobacterales bacterium]
MTKPLEIVIVGGGTAGWMTAAAFSGVLARNVARVRLIESDEIGTVGVGEATLPQIRDFNEHIGVLEPDMMRKANATFKLGIEFVDWGAKGRRYIHPFGVHGHNIGGAPFHQHWVRAIQNGKAYNLEDFSYAIVASRNNKFDFPAKDDRAINSTYSYAYHFDAHLYARFLREFAEARGLERIEGRIVEVALHPERGDIASVKLASGQSIEADLWIDCSGFRALLIGEALKGPYEDWSKWLPCDRAMAAPCERGGDFTPYTRSTAREAGWQWRIPLQHRTGNGYVYSSSFISDDKAAQTLLKTLDGKALAEPRPIRFKAGRRSASWTKNCVAIGLSSGFLEPLESTSIYLVQMAILNFLKMFPRTPIDPALAAEFNRRVDTEYDRVRDFLILHYHLNSRADSELWKYCSAMDVPDSLKQKVEQFRHRGYIEKYKDGLFSPASWLSVLIGQGAAPRRYERQVDNMPLDAAIAEMEALKRKIADRVALMPSHDAFVRDYCASGDARVAAGAPA